MPNGFISNSILLVSEGQANKGAGKQVSLGASTGTERPRAEPELHIGKAEQGTMWVGRSRCTQIFPGTEEKIKTDDKRLGSGVRVGSILGSGHSPHVANHRERQRFHTGRWRIVALPGTVQRREAEVQVTMKIQARVWGPQPGIRLANRSYGVLHCPSADRVAAGSDCAGAVLLGKQEEEWHGVTAQSVGVKMESGTEVFPEPPRGTGVGGSLARQTACCRFLKSAPVKAVALAEFRGCSVQEVACG